MDEGEFFEIFRSALEKITDKRYFKTERGYQAQLYAELYCTGRIPQIFHDAIMESEYQKAQVKHNTRIRPDIIIHIPLESGRSNNRCEGNYCAIAIKGDATPGGAKEDFDKLDELFDKLNYGLGIFLNVDSEKTFYDDYKGTHRDKLHCYAVKLDDTGVRIFKQDKDGYRE